MNRIARTLMSLALVGLVLGGCNQATDLDPGGRGHPSSRSRRPA